MADEKEIVIECPICKRVVVSGTNEASVNAAAAAHQAKAHPKAQPKAQPRTVKK